MFIDRRTAYFKVDILALMLFIVGIFAFVGSLFLWGKGFILHFPPNVDYSGPVADLLINAPACFLAAVGLWRRSRFGYVLSQFAAGFFIYASVEIFVKMAQHELPAAPEILGPQILVVLLAVGLIGYLDRVQHMFR